MLFLYTQKFVPSQIIIKEASHQQLMGANTKLPNGSLHCALPLGAWGSSLKREKNKCKRQNGQGHQESTAHRIQLSRAHGGSQRWKQQSQSVQIICIYVIAVQLVFLCDS